MWPEFGGLNCKVSWIQGESWILVPIISISLELLGVYENFLLRSVQKKLVKEAHCGRMWDSNNVKDAVRLRANRLDNQKCFHSETQRKLKGNSKETRRGRLQSCVEMYKDFELHSWTRLSSQSWSRARYRNTNRERERENLKRSKGQRTMTLMSRDRHVTITLNSKWNGKFWVRSVNLNT